MCGLVVHESDMDSLLSWGPTGCDVGAGVHSVHVEGTEKKQLYFLLNCRQIFLLLLANLYRDKENKQKTFQALQFLTR